MRSALFLCVVALVLACVPANAALRIRVDLATQRMSVTKDGGDTVVWKVSSGRSGFETPTGRFSVMRMEADHYSDEYDQAPMPYAIFFSPRGLAIHGTNERGLGRPLSHGCVRLSVPHAQELYGWVEKYGAVIEIVGEAGSSARRPRENADRRRDGEWLERRPAEFPTLGGNDYFSRY